MAAANEMVSNYIPDEITYSILSKLPLKSLKRFECVNKSWSFLFQDHHFINKFLSCNDPDTSLILWGVKNFKEVFFSFSGERFQNKVQLDWSSSLQNGFSTTDILGFGSVNGTLCFYGGYGHIVLWNPATQEIKPLPDSESQFIEGPITDEALGYPYCAVNFLVHGFGYDPVINDYKVIRFINIHLERLAQSDDDTDDDMVTLDPLSYTGLDLDPFWEIYSLRSNSWRKLHVDMPYSVMCYHGTQVYADGVCHWLCEKSDSISNVGPCLVSFYLSNEEFKVTLIPSDVDDCFVDGYPWIKLAVLNGSITLISYHKKTTTFHISILGEFSSEESWTKLLIVGPLSCVKEPIGVGMKGGIIFIRKDNELVWLDLSTQRIAELGCKGEFDRSQIIVYKESILPMEGISD